MQTCVFTIKISLFLCNLFVVTVLLLLMRCWCIRCLILHRFWASFTSNSKPNKLSFLFFFVGYRSWPFMLKSTEKWNSHLFCYASLECSTIVNLLLPISLLSWWILSCATNQIRDIWNTHVGTRFSLWSPLNSLCRESLWRSSWFHRPKYFKIQTNKLPHPIKCHFTKIIMA